jgi:hypothetical protein
VAHDLGRAGANPNHLVAANVPAGRFQNLLARSINQSAPHPIVFNQENSGQNRPKEEMQSNQKRQITGMNNHRQGPRHELTTISHI